MYSGYKVPSTEVTQDSLKKIVYTVNTYKGGNATTVPATLIDNWDANAANLNLWMGQMPPDPTMITFDESKVSANTNKAISAWEAWVDAKPKRHG